MSDPRPRRLGKRHLRSVGVGVAGVAAAFAVIPVAQADSQGSSSGPSTSADAGVVPAATTTTTTSTDTSSGSVTPDYGYQKYRVGVQIKSGAYVPAGTTTAGTVLTIVEKGPGVGGTQTTTCTTDASTAVDGSTATFCLAPQTESAQVQRAAVKGVPTPSDAPQDQLFTAPPGDSITITQTSVEPGLVLDTSTAHLKRCTINPDVAPICLDDNDDILSTDFVFTDPGLPPVAVKDSYSVQQPNSVDIHVLTNDTTAGAPASVTVDSGPSDGTLTADEQPAVQPQAKTIKAAALVSTTGAFTYQPKAGFSGVDHFTYTLTTANGTSTAVVTITVTAAAAAASTPPPLADTGTHSGQLLELGGVLLLAGGAATAFGRRRRPSRHAG